MIVPGITSQFGSLWEAPTHLCPCGFEGSSLDITAACPLQALPPPYKGVGGSGTGGCLPAPRRSGQSRMPPPSAGSALVAQVLSLT